MNDIILKSQNRPIYNSFYVLPKDENRYGEGGVRLNGPVKNAIGDKPVVSVVTIVYNDKNNLEDTINSVLNQNYPYIDYVIIDGGSKDGTVNIIKKYDSKIDYWVSERDEGIYDAINKGIKLCQGELIKIINSGDLLDPSMINSCVDVYMSNKKKDCIINSYIQNIYEKGGARSIWTTEKRIINNYNAFNHPSWLVPRSIYEKFGLYSLDYQVSSDYEYYLRLMSENVPVHTIKKALVSFREGGVSNEYKGAEEDLRINKIYFGKVNAYYDYFKRKSWKFLKKRKEIFLSLNKNKIKNKDFCVLYT